MQTMQVFKSLPNHHTIITSSITIISRENLEISQSPTRNFPLEKNCPAGPPRRIPVAPASSVTFETLVVHAWTVTGRGHHHLRRPRRTHGSPSSTWRGGFSVFFPERTRGIFSVFSHLYYGRLSLVGCWKTKGLINKIL